VGGGRAGRGGGRRAGQGAPRLIGRTLVAVVGAAGEGTELRRTTSRRSRVALVVVAVVLTGAIGLSLVDMAGFSKHQVAQVHGGAALATTTARDFGYVPAQIHAPRGVPVRVTLQNQGAHTHTFTIDGLGVDVVIPARTTTVVTVRPPVPGVYQFYCRFHQALGMRGEIVVAR